MKSGEAVYIEEPPEGPICDFCSDGQLYASYPAQDFNAGQFDAPDVSSVGTKKVNVNSEGDWAACKTCADLIDTGEWDALLDRSVETYIRRHGTIVPAPELRKFVADLHRMFRENRQQIH